MEWVKSVIEQERGRGRLEGFPPTFATNNPNTKETVAEQIRILIDGSLEDLGNTVGMSIATAYLNVGGFEQIAHQLERVGHVRILLGAEPEAGIGSPKLADYLTDNSWLQEVLDDHEQWLRAERDLTAFTLEDDQAARRLVKWLQSVDDEGAHNVEVRRFVDGFLHGKAFIIDHRRFSGVLAGSSNFTYAGLMTNRELNLGAPANETTAAVQNWFDDLWSASQPYDLAGLYAERWEPHSPELIFLRMLFELYGDQSDDERFENQLALTKFQRDGVARAVRLMEQNGGVLVADEVGLGKTFIAGEIIRRSVEIDRQRALIVCPAAVRDTVWNAFLDQQGYSRRAKVLSYEELRNRYDDEQDGEAFRKELDDYALVVVDEAHNLRNTQTERARVVTALLGGKYPKKTVLLTATPVNNSLMDLYALLSYFIKNDGAFASVGIPSIRNYIKAAQDLDPDSLSPQHLFDLMDQVAVRRTRRFVRQNYLGDRIKMPNGREMPITFPTPRVQRLDYRVTNQAGELLDQVLAAISITDDDDLVTRFDHRERRSDRLVLARYTTSAYLRNGELENFQVNNSGLLRSALLKRLESSPASLAATLDTMIRSHQAFLSALEQGYVLAGDALTDWATSASDDLDEVLAKLDDKRETQVQDARLFHVSELQEDVEDDCELLRELAALAHALSDQQDAKVDRLVEQLRTIARDARTFQESGPSSTDRRKTLVFSSFTDTVDDLWSKVSAAIDDAADGDPLSDFKGRVAPAIFGARGGTAVAHRTSVIAHFAPATAGSLSHDGTPTRDDSYDLLITTDVLAEGVNLQQAGRMINYDLPWNPMRLVQRAGRIDRIGSPHPYIEIGCFFPNKRLDEMLHLEDTLMRKLAYADAAIGTGQVLPDQRSKTEVVLADTKDQIEALRAERPELFEGIGDMSAISGEEFRRRLTKSLGSDTRLQKKLMTLPYGSGSGFVSATSPTNGYVFCLKMGSQDKPWFRFVPVDEHWTPRIDRSGSSSSFEIEDDTLTALSLADPGSSGSARFLDDAIFSKAFESWRVAQDDAFTKWTYLTNPNNLMPEIEKAFRDATELVLSSAGAFLGYEEQTQLATQLNGRWGADVKMRVRNVLNTEGALPRQKVEELRQIADDFGLQPPPPPQPLPVLALSDIRPIAWMAITNASSA